MFFVIANNAGLDLVNTRGVQNGEPIDLMTSFDDLIDWSAAAGLIDQKRAREIVKKWSGSPAADRVFQRAVQLRDTLASISSTLLRGDRPSDHDINEINSLLREEKGWFKLQAGDLGYSKVFHTALDDIDGILVPIAESLADLLCFGDLTQIKKCQAEECVLVFYDTSKNHRRRWCSMAECGNRAKANAFYKRRKGQTVT